MKEQEENNEKKVSWNLSEAIMLELSELSISASRLFTSMKYLQAFLCLKAMKMRISHHLDIEEKRKFRELEISFYNQLGLSKQDSGGFETETPEEKKARARAYVLYEEFNDLLMKALDKYGYGVQPRENRTKMI